MGLNTMQQGLWLFVVILLGVSTFDVSAQNFNITDDPDNSTICKNGVIDLDCGYIVTMATRVFTPVWIINGTAYTRSQINSNDTPFPLQWLVDGNNTNTTDLRVGPVDERYLGQTVFQCAFLSVDVLSAEAVLTIIGTPSAPAITISVVRLRSFTILWTISDNKNNNVCGPVMYKVTISEPSVTNTTRDNMYTFTGLTPNTNYTITVTPYNNAGDGTPASIIVMTNPTVPFPPTDVRLNLEFNNGTPNITASWIAPELESSMTRIEQYSLTLYVNGLLQPTKIVSADTTMVDIFSVFGVVGERYTNYSLSVAAINSAGMGEFRESDVLITRYIQGGEPTSGVGMITISCTTAPSEPPVGCDLIYMCLNGTRENVTLENPFILMTTQPCNITIKVVFRDDLNTVDQVTYTDVTPLVQPSSTTITTTPGPTPSMPPTEPSRSSSDDDTGSIVGAVIGVLACVGLIVFIILCMCWCRYRRRRKLALIPCAIKCTCCTCLLCAYCAKKRRGSMKPMTTGNDKTDTGNSNSSGDSPDSPNSTDAFVMNYKKENTEGNPTKNSPQPVALYSEIEPAPKKNGLVPATSVPSQYSVITQEEDTDTNNTVEGMPMYSQVNKSKKTIRVQQLTEYSTVHKPTKAEGKVDNYTDLADIGPYPTKRPPQDKVQYTEVTPSDATPSDSGTQYTNVDHINDGPIHLSADHKAQYSVVQ
ncbi:uncharacterized protein [Dysidea avara]|uniref:uncharacterized protein isoform X3 n=1 Tax=Dysidea avara TaxID=196820 RepID=UPI00332FC418